MKKEDLDRIFFVYCNSIHDALDRKDCKQAKGFIQEMFNEYTKIRNNSSNLKTTDKPKVVILDDNELSITKYAEEYPENFKAITENLNNTNRGEHNG